MTELEKNLLLALFVILYVGIRVFLRRDRWRQYVAHHRALKKARKAPPVRSQPYRPPTMEDALKRKNELREKVMGLPLKDGVLEVLRAARFGPYWALVGKPRPEEIFLIYAPEEVEIAVKLGQSMLANNCGRKLYRGEITHDQAYEELRARFPGYLDASYHAAISHSLFLDR